MPSRWKRQRARGSKISRIVNLGENADNAIISKKKGGVWGCLDCSHRSDRADHLRDHMINNHHRERNDPFFKTLNYTRWETCPGCKKLKSKLSLHKKSCKKLLARKELNEATPSREADSSEDSTTTNANPDSDEANEDPSSSEPDETCAKYACPNCAYTTKYGFHLRRHMKLVHKLSPDDAFFRTMCKSGKKACPKCYRRVFDLPQHKKTCPKWLPKVQISPLTRFVREVKPLRPQRTYPVLKMLKIASLEECFQQYLEPMMHSTVANYGRLFRTFCRFYEEQESAAVHPQDFFLTAKYAPGKASILRSTRVKAFLSQCTTSVALNAAKALTKFLKMYEDFLVSISNEMHSAVFQESRGQIARAKLIISEMRHDVQATKRDQTLSNGADPAATPSKSDLGSRPEDVRKYCVKFIQSSHISKICDWIKNSSCQETLEVRKIPPKMLRDMTMGLLELTTGGILGVSIRSLTLKEFQDREVVSEDPFEVIMQCHANRVAHPLGVSKVVVRSPIVMTVLSRYVKLSRPLIGNPDVLDKPESPLFPTEWNRIPCSTKNGISWVKGVLLKKIGINDEADPDLASFNSRAIRNAFISNSEGSAYFKEKMAAGPISASEMSKLSNDCPIRAMPGSTTTSSSKEESKDPYDLKGLDDPDESKDSDESEDSNDSDYPFDRSFEVPI